MLHLVLLFYALIHASLLIWVLSISPTNCTPWQKGRVTFVCALLIGMLYDNLITGIGNFYFEQDWYSTANVPRFVLHALILPFLPLFAFSLLQETHGRMRHQRLLFWPLIVVCSLALLYGLYHEVILLQLGDKSVLGVQKLGNMVPSPPWATIVSNLIFLPMAWLYWRAAGWPWMFFGGLFIFVLNGASAGQSWGFLVGNFAEVVFIVSLLLTTRQHQQSMPA